ncbi:putative signaling protein [BD1-7 clade bacterium]|uniref:Putative signaling protein n=1 Tax=BD1-7 clade bacterium TaxID=2029982 RepID=A0A5S9N4F2_9GAMM|nr:putative signaling protein [BD1-7 clade bacterium]CAA0084731.1 putative signaling protein [BD1-7 clade bacterium]
MLLDRCLHPSLTDDSDTLYKARVLVSILWIYIAIISAVDIWLSISEQISQTGRYFALSICISMQVGFLISLWLLRFKAWFLAAAHLMVGATAFGIAAGVAVSGGPMMAPATPMNILPIIMAFVLINKRAGLLWTQIILTLHIGFIIASTQGFAFPQLLSERSLPMQHLSHWLIIYSAMIGLMFVYDSLNSRLKAERDAERQKFRHLASHDPLTNLANRLQFDDNLEQSLHRSDRHKNMTALLFIDLDGFKPINDSLGHDAGDVVLKTISQRLQKNLRGMDTVARLGGDEFGVILEDITDITNLNDIACKLLEIIAQPIKELPEQPAVSGSIGISLYPAHTRQKTTLIKYADTAMYAAKRDKNRWCLFLPEMVDDTFLQE